MMGEERRKWIDARLASTTLTFNHLTEEPKSFLPWFQWFRSHGSSARGDASVAELLWYDATIFGRLGRRSTPH